MEMGEMNGVSLGPGERLLSALAGSAVLAFGVARSSIRGLGEALVGGAWVSPGRGPGRLVRLNGVGGASLEVNQGITVQRARPEVYAQWRDLRNYPRFMQRLDSVEALPEGRVRWRARGMLGKPLEWVSTLKEERQNELLTWASMGGLFDHSAEIRFSDAPGSGGTELRVRMRYRAPGGRGALALARLLGDHPLQVLAEDLRRFRQWSETGEIATVAGQPQGPRSRAGRALTRRLSREGR